MKDRIKELYLQARQEAWNEPIDIENCAVEDIKGFSQQVYEKFAELIVLECSSICYKGLENGDEAASLLMNTFGVEE
jgi:hypothetical protein